MQVMAVAYGGRLHQHLPEALGHEGHRTSADLANLAEHAVRLAPGTALHKIFGDALVANSKHHQGVADPGRLTPVGWSVDDDLIEAVEDPDRAFAVGVQWHPEAMGDLRVFAALVAAARADR
jgi:putative glutamine amidotransferase